MAIRISRREATDYLLVYLLAAISGMPFFDGDIPMLGVFGVAFLMFYLRKEGFYRAFFFYLFAFIILLLLHSLRFNYIPLNTYIGFIVKVTVGYLVVATLKQDFITKYIKIICFLSAVSFIFFVPLFLSPAFDSIFEAIGVYPPFEPGSRKSLILYHLNLSRPGDVYRNCGPFWEPAAFGGYVLLAFMFNLAKTGKLKGKQNLLLIATLISTFSTTVYLLLAIILFFHFFFNQTFLVKLITVPVIGGTFVIAFLNIPFLSEKIMEEIDRGDMSHEMRKSDEVGHTRLSSAFADYNDFVKYPLIGRGIFEQKFYDPLDVKTRHNGLTKHIAQFGILGAFLYFIPMFLAFYRKVKYSVLNNFMSVVFFIVLLGMGIAEGYFDKPFFWGLFFLHLFITQEVDADRELSVPEVNKTYA